MNLKTEKGIQVSAQKSDSAVALSFDKMVNTLELTLDEARKIGSYLADGTSATSENRVPRLGCAAIVRTKDNTILLGIRGKEPNKGKWILPGGGMKFLESFSQTLEREILEETGSKLRPER